MNSSQIRQEIRKNIRLKRRSLSLFQQKKAAKNLALKIDQLFLNSHFFCQKSRLISIGIYLAGDGEINPEYFQKKSRFVKYNRINFYYPIIEKDLSLKFGLRTNGTLPRRNTFQIPEPVRQQSISIEQLDVLLMPLVAATTQGTRLGMGGGFYDRTLSQLSRFGKCPLLIGIAHQLQIVDSIPTEAWDQKIDYIITDQQIICCNRAF